MILGAGVTLFNPSQTAHATNPDLISFQGKVVNADGTNVTDGTYPFTFKLYSVSSGGSALWTETYSGANNITVTSGVFQVELGSLTALPNFGSNPTLYLGITFNNDAAGEMTPRIHLDSVPYALNSDQLGGVAASNYARLDISNTFSGSQDVQNTATTALVVQQASAGSTLFQADTTNMKVGVGAAPSSGGSTLQVTGTLSVSTLGSNTNATYLCWNSSNQIASCNTTGNGAAFVQGGNSFGTTAVLGTNDNNGLNIRTNSTTVESLSATGAALFQNSTDSATGFQIQNTGGTALLAADTQNLQLNTTNLQSTGTLSVKGPDGGSVLIGAVANSAVNGTAMTFSGNEITDSTRATATQGDGRQPPDSSTGIWESTTNLVTNGGFESNATGWGSVNSATLTRVTSTAKFGSGSLQVVTPGTVAGEGFWSSPAITASASTTYAVSAWVKVPAGKTAQLIVDERTGAGAHIQYDNLSPTAGTGAWQRITATLTTSGTTGQLAAGVDTNATEAMTFWADGVQVEQKAFATPYVDTNGSTASRTAARIQMPVSNGNLNTSAGWVAMRVRTGEATGTQDIGFASVSDGTTSNRYSLIWNNTSSAWELGNVSGGTGSFPTAAGTGWSAGAYETVIMSWTATTMAVSQNGGSFTSVSKTNTPVSISTLDLGSLVGGSRWFDGDILWTAAGTGTLSNADAAALNRLGNSDPSLAGVSTIDSAATPTFAWNAESTAYAGTNNTPTLQSGIIIDDTNLYRSAANTLKTDDLLQSGVGVQAPYLDSITASTLQLGGTNATTVAIGAAAAAGTTAVNIANVQNGGSVSIGGALTTGTVAIGGSSMTTGTVTIQGGTGSGAVGIQAGTSGTISIGTTNADTVNLGAVGTTANATTVNIANTTGNATQTVNIGATNSASNAVLIQGGTGASAIALQTGASGTIGIGTANTANTIQVGSTTLSSGTQTINIGNNNTSGGTTNITIGTGSSATGGTTTVQGKGLVTLQSSGAGVTIDTTAAGQTTQIDNSAVTHTLNIATGAAVQGVTIGSTNSTSSLLLQGGTGNVQLQSQGGTLGIGNNAVAQNIQIGNTTGTTAITIQGGTGAISIGTQAVADVITLGNSTGATSVAINCGTGACNLGTNATDHSSTVGSTTGVSATTLQGGTGGINIGTANVANTIQIGNTANAIAQTINIGNNGTASSTDTVNIGNSNGSSTTSITAGTGNIQLKAKANDNYNTIQFIGRKPNAVLFGASSNLESNAITWLWLKNNGYINGTVDFASTAAQLAASDYDVYICDEHVWSATTCNATAFTLWKTYGKSVITIGNDTTNALYPITATSAHASSTYSSTTAGPHVIMQDSAGVTDIGNSSDTGQDISTFRAQFKALYTLTANSALTEGIIGESETGGVWMHDQTGFLDQNAHGQTVLLNTLGYETGSDARMLAARTQNAGYRNIQNLVYTDQANNRVGINNSAPNYTLDVNGTGNFGGLVTLQATGTANTSSFLCLNSSSQIASCGTGAGGAGTAFLQGGNSFGAQAVLGTLDANSLELGTFNGTALQQRINITNTTSSTSNATLTFNGAATFTPTADSATAFQIQNSAGTDLLSADTQNLQLNVGNLQSTGTLAVQGPDGGSVLIGAVANSGTGTNAMTFSGNEITDKSRATATQGDGRQPPDSSTGVWEATTNLILNGGAETNISNIGAWLSAAVTRTTTTAKFGSASVQVVTPGSAAFEGVSYGTNTGLAAVAGTAYTGSVWARGSGSVDIWTRIQNTDASITDGTHTTVTLNSNWQRITAPTNTVAAGKTGDSVVVFVRTTTTQAVTFYTDGAQVEQKSIATPYVDTNGATTTRNIGRVQAPATGLNATTGWFATRVRYGRVGGAVNSGAFQWGDATNGLTVYYGGTNWCTQQNVTGTTGLDATCLNAGSPSVGSLATVVGQWTGSTMYISVNGSAFTTLARSHGVPTISATSFDIGSLESWFGTSTFDGDVLWSATGTGTLSNADAAALNRLGNSDPSLAGVTAIDSAATPTFAWNGEAAAYSGTNNDQTLQSGIILDDVNLYRNVNSGGTSELTTDNLLQSAVGVQAPYLDTATAATLQLGQSNATAITLGNATNNILTTIQGTALVKPTPTHDSTTAFQVQPAGSTNPTLDVDTSNGRVGIGTNAPAYALDVVQNTGADSIVRLNNASSGKGAYVYAAANSNFADLFAIGTGQSWSVGQWGSTSLAIRDQTNNVAALTIAPSTGNLTVAGTYNTNTFTSSALTFGAASTATIDANGANNISINGTSTGDVLLAGGSGATGCTVTNATGNLTCTGNITGGSTGTQGYWSRSGTLLQPANSGDSIATTGNLSVGSTTAPTGAVAYFNGNVGIGTSSPSSVLQVVGTNGTFIAEDSTANSTVKTARWGIQNYNTAVNPFYGIVYSVGSGNNTLDLGGGTALGTAATAINFYTAANNSTNNGTIVASIGSNGAAAFQNSTDSSTGFQIQNTGGTDLLAADTQNLQLNTGNIESTGTIAVQGPDGGSVLIGAVANSGIGTNAMTFSGNEITDQTRATATQGDGRQPPDSSTGVWESTTNMLTNGGLESNATGWSTSGAGETLTRDTTTSKFGSAAGKLVGAAGGSQARITVALTSGQTYTASVWVKAVSGSPTVRLYFSDFIGGGNSGSAGSVTASVGSWQRVTTTWTATATKTWTVDADAGASGSFFFDGAQVEQKAIATPYVETNGSTATRNAGLVQAPSAAMSNTQGWVAARVRMGFASSGTMPGGGFPGIFKWYDGTGNNVLLLFVAGSSWNAKAIAGGTAVTAGKTQTYNAGDLATAIISWTATSISISVDGSTFTTLTTAAAPTGLQNVFQLGLGDNGNYFDGDILWTASGTGTLSNADAAALNRLGNSDPSLAGVNGIDSAATPSFVWNGEATAYAGTNNAPTLQSGIVIDDTNLYRSATNTLKTDDLLQSAVGVQAPSLDSITASTLQLGGTNATTVAIGSSISGGTTAVQIANVQNGGSVSVGTAMTSGTIAIGGSSMTTGTVSIQGGTGSGALGLQAGTGGTISMGTTNANTINIGSSNTSTAVNLTAGASKLAVSNTASAFTGATGTGIVTVKDNATGGTVSIGSDGTGQTHVTFGSSGDIDGQNSQLQINAAAGATSGLSLRIAGSEKARLDTNGNLGIGVTPTASAGLLQFAAGTTVANGIQFGADATKTDLYRSAASTLTTDASLTVGTNLNVSGTTTIGTLGSTNTAAYLCRNSSNIIAACNTTGIGAAFVQGGNSFGATAVLGTTDANSLQIGTFNGTAIQQRITISNTTASTNNATLSFAGTSTFQPTADSTSAFQIQNTGSTSFFTADSQNLQLNTGNIESTGTLAVQGPDGGSVLIGAVANSGTGTNALTFSGNEITDKTRATNTQGDGRQPPDSSTGVWESTTNMVPNGGFESNTSNWSLSRITAATATNLVKFGGKSGQMTVNTTGDAIAAPGGDTGALRLGMTGGNTYTWSAWVYVPSGNGTAWHTAIFDNDGTGYQSTASSNISTFNTWVHVSVTRTIRAGATEAFVRLENNSAVAGQVVYIDGAQVEQKPFATPYVDTNGSTASRSAARVQAPIADTSITQGWYATRVRMGAPSSSGQNFYLGQPFIDSNNRLALHVQGTTWTIANVSAGTTDSTASGTLSYNAGDLVTAVFAWTSGNLEISLNGGNFVTATRVSVQAGSLTSFDIGSSAGNTQIDGDVLWTTAGTGTLSNADALALYRLGNSDPSLAGVNTIDSAATPTFAWNAENTAYSGTNNDQTLQSGIILDDVNLYRNVLGSTSELTTDNLLQSAVGVYAPAFDTAAAGTLSIGTTNATTINVGTNSSLAETIGIGSSNSSDAVTVQGGASQLVINNSASTFTGALTSSGGAINLNASSNFATNINTGTSTGAVGIGNTTAGETVALQGGNTSSAVSIQSAASGTIGIGTANAANTIQVGSTTLSSGTQTIAIGNNGTSGGTTNITIGTASGATGGTTTVQGKGLVTLQSSGAGLTLDTTLAGQTTQIDNSAVTHTLQVATGAAVQGVTIGSTNSTSSLLLQAGTGNLQIQTQGGTLGIGNNAVAQTIQIGNTTGGTAVTVNCGTGTCNFGGGAVDHSTSIGSATGVSATTINSGTAGTAVSGGFAVKGYTTTNTSNTSAGQWTELGSCTITVQFQDCDAELHILGHGSGSATAINSTLVWRVKQQNALGGVPVIQTIMNSEAYITSSDIVAVTTQNDASATVVQLWGRDNMSFDSWSFTPYLIANSSGTLAWLSSAGFNASLPAGTQTATVYNDANNATLNVVGTSTFGGKITDNYTSFPSTFTNASGDFAYMLQASGTNILGFAAQTTAPEAILMTNNGYSLALGTSGSIRAVMDTSGNLTFQQATTLSTSTGNLTVQANGTSTLKLDTTGAGTVTLGSTATTINVGANTGTADAINIGSTNTGTAITLQGGADSLVVNNTASAFTGNVTTTGTVAVGTLGTANTMTILCRNASNQLATCLGGAGTAFIQGGNAFGAAGVLGTTDNNNMTFITNNITRLTLDTSGNLTFAGSNTIGTSLTNGNMTLQANGTGTLLLDTTGAGTVTIGSNATTISLGTGTANETVNVGNSSGNDQVNIANNTGTNTVNVGTNTSAANTIKIGGNGTSGGSNASTTVALQGGQTAETINTNGVTFQTFTNSTTALTVDNTIGAQVLGVDTTDTNLISNPGFEINATGWTGKGTGGAISQVNSSTIAPYLGVGSGQVTTSTTANAGASFNYTFAPNTTYTLSFYARVASNAAKMTTLNFGRQEVSGTDIDCLTGQSVLPTGWQRYYCTFTTGATITSSNVYVKDTGTSHTWYIDSVQLETNPVATPYGLGGLSLNGNINSAVSIRPQSDSSNDFQIQNAGNTASLFQVGSLANINNLVTNGSFEANTTGWAAKTAAGTITLSDDTTQATPFGQADMKVVTSGTLAALDGVKFPLSLSSSTGYELSFWIKVTSGSTSNLAFGRSDNGSTDTACTTTAGGSANWVLETCSFTTGTTSGSPYIFIGWNDTAARTFYIDGVDLETGQTTARYKDGSISLGSAAITSPVLIQNAANTNAAFVVANAAGNSGLTVDTNGSTISTNFALTVSNTALINTVSSTIFRVRNSTSAGELVRADNNVPQTGNNSNAINNNASFENGTTGWAVNHNSTEVPTFATDTTTNAAGVANAYSGQTSLKVATSASSVANSGVKYTLSTTTLASTTTYTFSFHAKLVSGQSAFTTLTAGRAENGSTETACTLNNATVTFNWQSYTCTFKTGTTSGTPYIYIGQTDASTVHSYYLDGVTFENTSSVNANNFREGRLQFNGDIVSPTVFRPQSDSQTAFQLQNSNGGQLLVADTTSVNQDVNGSVETGIFGYSASSANTTINQTTSQAYFGLNSLQVTTNTSSVANEGVHYANGTTTIASSTTYTLSFYAKIASGSFTTLVAGRAENGSTLTGCTLNSTTVTTSWTRYSCTFTTGTVSGTPFIYIGQSDASVAHTYYLDGIQLEANSAATPYREGQLQINGVITSPTVFQNTTDSTTALQVDQANGTNLFVVDTLDGQLAMGPGAVPGNGVLTVGTNTTANTGGLYFGTDTNLYRSNTNTLQTDSAFIVGGANSTNSSTAFQVQNTSNVSALTVDTSNLRVDVGTNGTETGQLYVSGSIPTSGTGSLATGNSDMVGAVVQGRYAYVTCAGTFCVIDVSNPASPVEVGSTGSFPGSFDSPPYAQGRYVYAGGASDGDLMAFDVSNPASPSSGSDTYHATIGGSSDNMTGVYVQGRYAYVIDNTNSTLYVVDISNPAAMTAVGSVSTGSGPQNVFVQGRYAYVTNNTAGTFQAFDISNPASPVSAGTAATAGTNPYGLYVQGRYAYVTNKGSNTLQIFDVKNPGSITSVATASTGSGPLSVYVQDRYAYVTNGTANTLQMFDVSNPASPAQVGSNVTTSTNPQTVYVSGRYAYVADFNSTFQVFDVGGGYVQQLEAGGVDAGTLTVNGDTAMNGNSSIQGGLTVGGQTQLSGDVAVTGNIAARGTANSTSAFQVQNASSQNVLQLDTLDGNLTVGSPYGTAPTAPSGGGTVGTWTSTTALTTAVYGATSVAYNGYIYNLGGNNGTNAITTTYYATISPAIGTWNSTTALPSARYNATSVVNNGYVYVIGGTNGTSDQTTVYYAKLSSTGAIGTWNTTTSLPSARELASSVVNNGYVYVLGGSNGGTAQSTVYYAQLNSNGTLGSWNTTASLPATRDAATAIVNNGYIYEITGSTSSTCTAAGTNTVYYAQLNPNGTVGSWITNANNTGDSRFGADGIVWGAHIYVLGGTTTSGGCSPGFLYHDASINSDGSVAAFNGPSATDQVFQATAAAYNGYGYMLGGTTTGSNTSAVTYYFSLTGSQGTAGSGGQNIDFAVNGAASIQTGYNTTTAFQVQDASGNSVLNVDTTNDRVGIGTSTASYNLSVVGAPSTGPVASIVNTTTTDSTNTQLLRLGLGVTSTTLNGRFIQFYAGATSDSTGTAVGHININNGAVNYATTGADYAEFFDAQGSISPGYIVGYSNGGVAKATSGSNIVGVVSDSYGFSGNYKEGDETNPNRAPVGLMGQIKVMVDTENGSIAAGDPITISSTPGVGMKATAAGNIVGYALESYSGSGAARIEVAVHPSYYDPVGGQSLQGSQSANVSDLNVSGTATVNNLNVTGSTTVAGLTSTGAANVSSLAVSGEATAGSADISGALTAGSLNVSGSTALASLDVAGATTTGSLTVSGGVNAVSATISGALASASLNVSGGATLASLSVTGNATFGGDITVNGHIVTGGNAPTAAVQSAAGTTQNVTTTALAPNCTISGTDTSGQITLITGITGWQAGTQCTITFTKSYSGAPHPVIAPASNVDTSTVKPYVQATPTGFTLNFITADAAQHTFTFNYFNAQ